MPRTFRCYLYLRYNTEYNYQAAHMHRYKNITSHYYYYYHPRYFKTTSRLVSPPRNVTRRTRCSGGGVSLETRIITCIGTAVAAASPLRALCDRLSGGGRVNPSNSTHTHKHSSGLFVSFCYNIQYAYYV